MRGRAHGRGAQAAGGCGGARWAWRRSWAYRHRRAAINGASGWRAKRNCAPPRSASGTDCRSFWVACSPARGVALDDVPVMLNPTLKALMPDPGSVRDMDAAAARLADAIEKRQSVAIFGDYDVDGACVVRADVPLLRAPRRSRRASTSPTGCSRATARTPPPSKGWSRRARSSSSPSTAAPPAASRWRAPASSAATSSSSIITRPTRSCRALVRWSIRTARTTCRGSGICARRASCFLVLVATRASCAGAASTPAARPSPI